MTKRFKIAVVCALLAVACSQTTFAYDIPQRRVEAKPYLNVFFPNDLWKTSTSANLLDCGNSCAGLVDNKTSFGFGVKLRTQFGGQFGIVLNAAYSDFKVPDGFSSKGALFTVGGYYKKPLSFGEVTFDLGYGGIVAADEVLGLLMPSLEFSRAVSERVSLALEFGLPVPNDWLENVSYREKASSFTVSIGTVLLF